MMAALELLRSHHFKIWMARFETIEDCGGRSDFIAAKPIVAACIGFLNDYTHE